MAVSVCIVVVLTPYSLASPGGTFCLHLQDLCVCVQVKIKVMLQLIVSESVRVYVKPHLGFMTSS
jgi:hypothetical protein